jgi:rhodanese-related sulfurtransferase
VWIGTIGGMADSRVQPIDTQVRLARAVVENLRPADLAGELESGRLVLVDVREPDELGQGVIDGAISVPRGVVEFVADPKSPAHRTALDPAHRIVVYSDTGARSALVASTLYALGYRDIAHLEGGIVAWVADGRALTTWPTTTWPLTGWSVTG